jgi:hypothetical protein
MDSLPAKALESKTPCRIRHASGHLLDSEMLPVWLKALDLRPVPKWRNWQTRMVQVHVLARVWGFESLLRHHENLSNSE